MACKNCNNECINKELENMMDLEQYTSSNNNNNNNNVVEPLPNEDPNGIAPLAGESDQQYMERQTRIRDEAKARMASKFGNQKSMQGVGSDSTATPLNNNNNNKSSSSSMTSATSNASKNNSDPPPPKPTKMKVTSNEDFFANFGA
mmetsp:Transcript_27601/g.26464  ORF Transcript_27601/g.26464 Transcript_27601/m.26464 type:complete len:146 (-) Transcript_27601:103-540(-)